VTATATSIHRGARTDPQPRARRAFAIGIGFQAAHVAEDVAAGVHTDFGVALAPALLGIALLFAVQAWLLTVHQRYAAWTLGLISTGWIVAAAADHPTALTNPTAFRQPPVSAALVIGIIITGLITVIALLRDGSSSTSAAIAAKRPAHSVPIGTSHPSPGCGNPP